MRPPNIFNSNKLPAATAQHKRRQSSQRKFRRNNRKLQSANRQIHENNQQRRMGRKNRIYESASDVGPQKKIDCGERREK